MLAKSSTPAPLVVPAPREAPRARVVAVLVVLLVVQVAS